MRDVRLLQIGRRELWRHPDTGYFRREWRFDVSGEPRFSEPYVRFATYDEAVAWVNAPEAAAKTARSSLFHWFHHPA